PGNIAGKEFRVFNAVESRILPCILNGFADYIYPYYFFCLGTYEYTNASRTAVKVIYRFCSCQVSIFARYPVQALGLPGIGLKERLRPDAERQAFQRFCYVAFTCIRHGPEVMETVILLGVD